MNLKYAVVGLIGLSSLMSCSKGKHDIEGLSKPKDQMEKISYSIGYDIGKSLSRDSIKINHDQLMRGIMDAMLADSTKRLLNDVEMKKAIEDFQKDMQAKQQAKMMQQQKDLQMVGEKNKAEGPKFLEANKAKPGVITLPSGVQYRIIKEGKGAKPKSDELVNMHLVGKFIDGKEFDNTYSRGPVDLPVSGLIKGWAEVLPLMPEGSKWEVVIPSELAYGEQGAGATIPPNSVLVFEMELLKIKGKAPKQPEQPKMK